MKIRQSGFTAMVASGAMLVGGQAFALDISSIGASWDKSATIGGTAYDHQHRNSKHGSWFNQGTVDTVGLSTVGGEQRISWGVTGRSGEYNQVGSGSNKYKADRKLAETDPGDQSSLGFTSISGDTDVADGVDFKLGSLLHRNRVIENGSSITYTELNLLINFEDPTFSQPLELTFGVEETPNTLQILWWTIPYNVPDVIDPTTPSVPFAFGPDLGFTFNKLEFRDQYGNVINQFDTQEECDTKVWLWANITENPSDDGGENDLPDTTGSETTGSETTGSETGEDQTPGVPEPVSATLGAISICGLGLLAGRRSTR